MRLLIDINAGKLLPVQAHSTAVVCENLHTLLAVLVWLDIEAANCSLVSALSLIEHLPIGAKTPNVALSFFLTS